MAPNRRPLDRPVGRPDALALDRRAALIEEWRPFLSACAAAFISHRTAPAVDDALRADGTGLAIMFADLYPDKEWSEVEPLLLEVIAGRGEELGLDCRGATDAFVIVEAKIPDNAQNRDKRVKTGVDTFQRRRRRLAERTRR